MKFPLKEKFPLPLEVVLDKQVATIKAASTAAQSLALLAVARAVVADLDSRQLVASMVEFLVQRTSESTDCLVPGLVHLLVVARAVEDLVVVPESQELNPAESGNGTRSPPRGGVNGGCILCCG